jgi:hypothetical protein
MVLNIRAAPPVFYIKKEKITIEREEFTGKEIKLEKSP